MRQSPPSATPTSLGRAIVLSLLGLAVVAALGGMYLGLQKLTESAENAQKKLAESPDAGKPNPQPAPVQKPVEGENRDPFVHDESQKEMVVSVADGVALCAQGGPGALTQLARVQAHPGSLFLVSAELDKPPTLRPDLLARVRDHARISSWWSNEGEALAYCDALIKAHRTLPSIFAKNSRRDLTYVHLFEDPAQYRGEVVHVRGRLRQINRYDPPLMASQREVRDLYEAWIFDERTSHPYCVLLTELPAGVAQVGKVDHEVTFDGYFFKRYRYKAMDSVKANEFREVPLLIGKTLTVLDPAPPVTVESGFAGGTLALLLGLIAGTGALVIGLTWWYRRQDRSIYSRLAQLCRREFVEPRPDSIPLAAPVGAGSGSAATGNSPKPHTYGHGHDKVRAVHRALGQGGIDSS